MSNNPIKESGTANGLRITFAIIMVITVGIFTNCIVLHNTAYNQKFWTKTIKSDDIQEAFKDKLVEQVREYMVQYTPSVPGTDTEMSLQDLYDLETGDEFTDEIIDYTLDEILDMFLEGDTELDEDRFDEIFEEYEDHTEEKIVSIEHWDDEDEYSSGYYLDPWEFGREGEIRGGSFSSGLTGKTTIFGKAIIIIIFVLAFMGSSLKGLIPQNKKIEPYLKKQTFLYEYVTSITGEEKQKANVYEYLSGSSLLSNYSEEEALNKVAQDIIDGINGNSSAIQQNDEKDDHTVAILTSKEYCIIYRSEDDKILVQVSSRKYAYSTDKEPYRSRNRTRRYYRRFYYSTGYNDDSGSYSRYHSSYDGYSDGTVTYDSNNGLNNYSNSVRQSSIASRSSDGGGLSSGK